MEPMVGWDSTHTCMLPHCLLVKGRIVDQISCSMDVAWSMYHSYESRNSDDQQIASKRRDELHALFQSSWDDYCDDQNYTNLHRIVLGLHGGDLSDAVKRDPWIINDKDSCARTALMWAIIKNDPRSARILLDAKADPELK